MPLSFLNEVIQKVFYINLDFRTDRRQMIEKELSIFDPSKVTRFSAIYRSVGHLGCIESHLGVFEIILQNKWKNVLIVEDDMMWTHDNKSMDAFQKLFQKKFDVLSFGNTQAKVSTDSRLLYGLTTTAYVVKNHQYKKMYDNLKESYTKFKVGYDMNWAIDVNMTRLQKVDKWQMVQPCLAIQRPSQSDLESRFADHTQYFQPSFVPTQEIQSHVSNMVEPLYSKYSNQIRHVQSKNDPFKRHPDFVYMLEHVNVSQAEEYLRYLRKDFQLSDATILDFCQKNDSFGNPMTEQVGNLQVKVSPSSLRYLMHASLILKHLGNHTSDFVEIGCGQGGLFLAIQYLGKEKVGKQHMVDLEDSLHLLKITVGDHDNIVFHNAKNFGKEVPDKCFFISNYCQSEIDAKIRNQQKENLVRRCSKGFLVWNNISLEDIGHATSSVSEQPKTGPQNFYVQF